VRLLDAAVVEDDRFVVIGVVEPRDYVGAAGRRAARVRRLALIDVSVRRAHRRRSASTPPSCCRPSALSRLDGARRDARLLVAGDGCAYVVRAGGVLCVDVDLALTAEHDAVQRHCIRAAAARAGGRGRAAGASAVPRCFVTRAHGAFACARSAAAAPRDVQRAPRAHAAAAAVGADRRASPRRCRSPRRFV
jgi:hypothetical protein